MVSARSLNKRSTSILIAVILAIGTGFLCFNYLSSASKVAVTVPMRTVVIATQDIPVRTVITPAMLTTGERAANAIDPDADGSVSAVAGQIALITIPNGSILSDAKVGRIGMGGLTVRIPTGQRAISIALDKVKGVSNLVQAGDHVDVLAVTQGRGAADGVPTVSTILRNKTVLAMGTALEAPAAAASGATPAPDVMVETATLAVTPKEAKIVALADLNATLRLDLRSVKDQRSFESPEPFVLQAANRPQAVNASAAPAPAVAAPKPATSVLPHRVGPPMIDGDKYVN